MAWVATAIVGGSVVSALIGANSAAHAADAQSAAANNAIGESNAQYKQTREDQAPWRQAGVSALQTIQGGDFNRPFNMTDFHNDPGYQFQLQQGQQAIQRSAAARGLSTGTLKNLDSYSQGLASTGYNDAFNRYQSDTTNRFNRLASVAGLGQSATNATTAAGTANSQAVGSAFGSIGNAQSAGSVGTANAVTGAIGTGMNTWMQSQMLNRLAPQTPNYAGALTGQNAVTYSPGSSGGYGLGIDYSGLK